MTARQSDPLLGCLLLVAGAVVLAYAVIQLGLVGVALDVLEAMRP